MTVITRCLAILLICLMACGLALAEDQAAPSAADITVVVEGLAACPKGTPQASCRHAALADALRRAVEKAVGVMVQSGTRTKNFMLTEDTIRTTSEGYVRDYHIMNEGMDADNTYRIKIEAHVAPGKPEQTVARICRQLKEELNPSFRIAIEGPAGKILASELAAYGLKVSTKKADITISGRVAVTPEGEKYGDYVMYASGAYTQLSVTEAKSSLVIPSVDVELSQPVGGDSGEQSDRKATYTICEMWVQRNIPIIAQALLEPGKPVDVKPALKSGISPAAIQLTPSANLIPSDGPRLPIKPDDLAALAGKLKQAVDTNPEFSTKPVEIAVARFKGIGISDAASVEDVLEDLSTALVKTGVFRLVERTQLDKVLLELKIENSGLVDSATARQLGKLAGVSAVLVGSISDRKDCVVINTRLINTETGLVSTAESIVIDKETEPQPVILRAGPGS